MPFGYTSPPITDVISVMTLDTAGLPWRKVDALSFLGVFLGFDVYEEVRGDRRAGRGRRRTDIKGGKATGYGTTQSSDSGVITSTLQA